MTKAKIAITLPMDQLKRARAEVKAGRAPSVSGYISRALTEREERESMRAILDDLIALHGKPSAEDRKWAQRALTRRKG